MTTTRTRANIIMNVFRTDNAGLFYFSYFYKIMPRKFMFVFLVFTLYYIIQMTLVLIHTRSMK